jgi:HK97 gp10 family phage protein
MSTTADISRVIQNIRGIETYLDNTIRAKDIFTKAGKVVVQQMKSEVPVDEGVLKQSVKILPKKSRNSIAVGPKFRQKNRPTNHAHLVNYGHVTPSGKYIPGTPYIERTYSKTKDQVSNIIIQELKAAFERAGKSSAGFI